MRDQHHSFTAIIEAHDGSGAHVSVPFDVEAAFGKKRVKVQATFDGVPYRGSIVRMGGPDHMLIVRKDIRERINKSVGDEVEVTLMEDTQPRAVAVPGDMQEALWQHPTAASFFKQLAYTHRKEYVQWIENAKKPETRARRVEKAVSMLRNGRKGR